MGSCGKQQLRTVARRFWALLFGSRRARVLSAAGFLLAVLLLLASVLLLVLPPNWKPAPAWCWSGAVTATSARVITRAPLELAREIQDSGNAQEGGFYDPELSDSDFAFETIAATLTLRPGDRTFSVCGAGRDGLAPLEFRLTGLSPATRYEYEIEFARLDNPSKRGSCAAGSAAAGVTVANSNAEGKFHTAPSPGTAMSFSFGTSSCSSTASNHEVFDMIRKELDDHQSDLNGPSFFLHQGDIAYTDIGENSTYLYANMFESVMSSERQRQLWRESPIAYVWDDHDFGPNNADKSAAGRTAARVTYQRYAPHYPLAASSTNVANTSMYGVAKTEDVAIYQRFDVGKTRFLMLDLRSERSDEELLGASQKLWLTNQIFIAARSGEVNLLFIVSGVPWLDDSSGWGPYSSERAELARVFSDAFANASSLPVMMLSADAHSLAFDDGVNNEWGGFPVVQAASLDRQSSVKGGPYSHGCWDGIHQFAIIDVVDPSDPVPTRPISFTEQRANILGASAPCVMISFFSDMKSDPVFTFNTCAKSRPNHGCEASIGPSARWLFESELAAFFCFVFAVLTVLSCCGLLCYLKHIKPSTDSKVEMSDSSASVSQVESTTGSSGDTSENDSSKN